MEHKKGLFNIHTQNGSQTYEGYADGELWNGFSTPKFTKKVGCQIVKDTKNDENKARFSTKNDEFIYRYDEEDNDIYPSEIIVVNGEELNVYGIGLKIWTWTRVNSQEV